jgi:hypothetical protein
MMSNVYSLPLLLLLLPLLGEMETPTAAGCAYGQRVVVVAAVAAGRCAELRAQPPSMNVMCVITCNICGVWSATMPEVGYQHVDTRTESSKQTVNAAGTTAVAYCYQTDLLHHTRYATLPGIGTGTCTDR